VKARMLRRAVLAATLVVAAVSLSGCFVVYHWSDGTKNITIPPAISDRIIWKCTAEKGTGAPRAFCALDTIHAICTGVKIKGISESDCNHISSYSDWEGMDYGIQHVIGPDDCLSFFWKNGGYPDDFWGSVFKGFAGCK
jgi:hypothetical protein